MPTAATLKEVQKAFRGQAGQQVIRLTKAQPVADVFGLEPVTIASVIRGVLEGEQDSFQQLCALFDRYLIADARLRGDYEKRLRKVVSWDYQIVASEDDPQGEEIAEAMRRAIRGIPRFRRQVLFELADAIGKGISHVELSGQYDGAKLAITGAHGVPQWAIRESSASGWEHRDDKAVWQPVPAGKLLQWTIERGGSYITAGLMWPLIWLACFANFGLKDWLSFLEIYGVPLRVGKYPDGYKIDSTEVQVLAAAVIDVASDAGCIIPESMKIEFVEALKGSSSDAFKAFQDHVHNLMSMLLLGGHLTTDAGEKGARSLGEVQENETHEIVKFDADDLAEAIDEGLLKPLVQANFGERPGYPTFVFSTTRPSDKAKQAAIDTMLLDRSLPMSKSYLYATYCPGAEPDDEADALVRAPQALPLQMLRTAAELTPHGLSVLQALPGADDPRDEIERGRMIDGLSESALQALRGEYRALLIALARAKQASTDSEAEQIPAPDGSTLRSAIQTQLGQIVAAGVLSGVYDAMAEARRELLPGESIDMADVLDQAIEQLKPEGNTALLEARPGRNVSVLAGVVAWDKAVAEMPRDEQGRIRWDAVRPERAIEYWSNKAGLTESQYYALDEAAQRYAWTIGGQESQKVIDAARQGIDNALAKGETFSDFNKLVRAAEADAGVLDVLAPYKLRQVFTQNVLTSYGAGRMSAQRSAGVKRFLPYLIYITAGDDRVRDSHAALAHVCKPADDPFWDSYYPPWEWNCRCYARSVRRPPEYAITEDFTPPPLPEAFASGGPLTFWRTKVQEAA